MPTRTIDPIERDVIRRLVSLGVGSAAATYHEARRLGYDAEAIAGLCDYFESDALVDPATGQRVLSRDPGQLVLRLRDEYAVGQAAHLGKWGGRSAAWSALKLRLEPTMATKSELIPHRRAALAESVSRRQTIQLLGQLIAYQRDRSQPTDRAQKCLSWCEAAADWPLIPPAAVMKFLREQPIEHLQPPPRDQPGDAATRPSAPSHLNKTCHRCQSPCSGANVSLGNPICDRCLDLQLEEAAPCGIH